MNADDGIDIQQAVVPGLARRLAALFYDLLLLAAVLLVAVAVAVLPLGLDVATLPPIGRLLFQLYLLAVALAFFCWPWIKSGQTLGMRTWRIRLIRDDGKGLSLKDALVRAVAAPLSLLPLGLGYLWVLFDADSLAWHDRLSHTRLVSVRRPD